MKKTFNQSIDFRTSILPHLVAIIVFLIVSYSYFPNLLLGEEVSQYDRDQWQGTAQEQIEYRQKTGKEQLWSTRLFGGMPNVLISLIYPYNVAGKIDGVLRFGARPASYFFLMMLGFYLLLRAVGVTSWLSLAGALAYGFSTYFFIIVGAGHNAKLHALCYMAPLAASLIYTFRGHYISGSALFGLCVALSLTAGHLQITYYSLFILVALWIAYMVYYGKQKAWHKFFLYTFVLGIGGMLGIGANFNRLYNTWDYGRETIRGESELDQSGNNEKTGGLDRSYITGWSYGIAESFNMYVPNLMGGSSSLTLSPDSHVGSFLSSMNVNPAQQSKMLERLPLYWGDQPMTAGPVYLGATVIFLFILSLFLLRGPLKWACLSVGILALLLSWGKNFPFLTDLFLDYMPGYNKFRSVSMILVIVELIVPFMAFWGLHTWWQLQKERTTQTTMWRNPLFLSLIIAGGLALIIFLIGSTSSFTSPHDAYYVQSGYPEAFVDALRADRADLLRTDSFRSLGLVLLVAILLYSVERSWLKTRYFIPLLCGVLLLDLWPVNRRYDGVTWVKPSHKEAPFTKSRADEYILQDTGYFRVGNFTVSTFNDASTSYFHRSIGGYHGAKLRLFQDMVDGYAQSPFFWDMLNTRYFIVPGEDGQAKVRPNPMAYGAVWLVDSLILVDDAQQAYDALPNYDLQHVAIIRKEDLQQKNKITTITSSPTDTIYFLKHEGDCFTYHSNLNEERLAVFSEIYYPRGWTAYVKDTKLPVERVDYFLRGVWLPAGSYDFTLQFDMPVYRWGQWVDLTCGMGLLVALLISGLIPWFKRKTKEEKK